MHQIPGLLFSALLPPTDRGHQTPENGVGSTLHGELQYSCRTKLFFVTPRIHAFRSKKASSPHYQHQIHPFDFTALDGNDKWTVYRFAKVSTTIGCPHTLSKRF